MENSTGHCRSCDVEFHHGEKFCGECGAALDPGGRDRSVHGTTEDGIREPPASPEVKNRLTGDVSGSALQIGVVHGDVSVSGGPDADVARQVLDMLLTGTALPPPSPTTPVSAPEDEQNSKGARPRGEAGARGKRRPPPDHPPAAPKGAALVIGNLGPDPLKVLLDGVSTGTVSAGRRGRFPVEPGLHTVQVDSGGRRSAVRRIEPKQGRTVRVAFDVGAGSDAGPEPVEQAAFKGGWETMALKFAAVTVLPLVVAGVVIIPNSTVDVPMSEQLSVLFGTILVFGAVGGLLGVNSCPRLVLRDGGLEYGDRSWRRSISWSDLTQVSVVGEGGDARLVVWPRKDRPLKVDAEHPRLKDFQGGKVVYTAKQIGVPDLHSTERLRGALRWFADERWVEQRAEL
ncbi:hypothetical protein [Nocardiopsis tropica]|uniref:PEGA domain-containing protein n=1 Tax=Nocardiopsis tropica TaxID=109330 RepID=A0ABV2A263_9ACTN